MQNKMLSLLAFIAAIGVQNLAYPAEQPAEFSRLEIKSIKLERTACFGRCPVYSVEIFSDGMVKFLGKAHVGQLGDRAASVNSGDFEFLRAAISHLNFFALRDSYSRREDGCTEELADASSIIITVKAISHEKTVTYDGGCMGMEELHGRIYWLAQTIDVFAGTGRWLHMDTTDIVVLEPLHTEEFSLRNEKGEDLVALLINKQHRILSNRGSAVVDKRTNTLFVQDTELSMRSVREFIKQRDIPGSPPAQNRGNGLAAPANALCP